MTCGVRSRVPAVWCVWVAAGLLARGVAGQAGKFCDVAALVINPQSATLDAACVSLGAKVPKNKECQYTLAGHVCSHVTCLDDPVQGAVWNRLGSLCFEDGCRYDDLDTSAIPTASAQQYCKKGSIVKRSDSCFFTIAGKMCDEPKCIGGGWDFTVAKCYALGSRCYGRDLKSDLAGAVVPVGQGGGLLYAMGAKLALMRGDPVMPCSEVACGAGGTWAGDSVCPPGKKCAMSVLKYLMYPAQGIPDDKNAVTSPCLANADVPDGTSCTFAPAPGPNPALAALKGATCSVRKCIDGKWDGRGKVYCGCDAANTAHVTFNLQGGITLDEVESGNSGVVRLNDPILFAVAGGSCEGCICAPATVGILDVGFICGTGTRGTVKCVRPSCSTHHFTISGYKSTQCPQGTLIPDKATCTVTRDTIPNSICDKAVCAVDQIEPASPRCAPAVGACLFNLPLPSGSDATLRVGCKKNFIVLKDDLCEFYNTMDVTTKCDRPKCTGSNIWDKTSLQCHDRGCHINTLPPAGVTPTEVRCGEDYAMADGQFCNYADTSKPTLECERKQCVNKKDIDTIVCHLDGCPYDSDANFWTHIKPLPAAGTYTVTGDPGCVQYGVIPKNGKCSFRSATWNCDATCFAHTSLKFDCYCLKSELSIPNEVMAAACPNDEVPATPTTCTFTHMNGDMCGDHICSQAMMNEAPKWDRTVVQCEGTCRTDSLPNAPSGSVLMLPAECGPGKEVVEGVVCASKIPGRMPEPCYEIKCQNKAWVQVRDDCVDDCIGFSCSMPLVDSPTKGTTVCMGKPCLQKECCVCSTDDAGFKKAPTYLIQSNPVICAVGTRHAVDTGKCGFKFSGPGTVLCYALTCQESGWVETTNTCTDPCSMHTCTAPWTDKPSKATLGCLAGGCTDPVCCNGGGCATDDIPPLEPHLELADTTQCSAGKTAAINIVCAVRVPGQPPCFEEKCTATGWDNVKDSCPDPCSAHTCTAPWTDKPSKNTLPCAAGGCTDDVCCIRQCLTSDLTIGPHLVPVNTAQCSAGKTVSADVVCAFKVPGQTPCYEKKCTASGWTPVRSDCPDPCAPHVCTAPWTDKPSKATLPCPPAGCTDTACCQGCQTNDLPPLKPHLELADTTQCSAGKTAAINIVCAVRVPGQPPCIEEKCTATGWDNVKDSCPDPCSAHTCTAPWTDKPSKNTLPCAAGGCTDDVCCIRQCLTNDLTIGPHLVPVNTAQCSAGKTVSADVVCAFKVPGQTPCFEQKCTASGWMAVKNDCPDPCAPHVCTAPWTDRLNKATLSCPPTGGCTDISCCKKPCKTQSIVVAPHLQTADPTQCSTGKVAPLDVVCAFRVPGQPPCFEEKCTASGWTNVKDSCPDPCSAHTCTAPWTDKPSKNTLPCAAGGCTDDVCCIRQCLTSDLTIGPHLVPVNTAQCSAGKTVSADVVCAFKVPGQTPCFEQKCTASGWMAVKNDCPDPCAPHVCTAPWTDRLNKATLSCPPTGGCTDISCCKKPCKTQSIVVAPHLQTADPTQCSTGKVAPLDVVCAFRVPGQPPCFEEKCTASGWTNVKSDCPLPCSSHTCTGQWIDKADKATLVCPLGGCSDAVCCDGTCAGYSCPVVQKPSANTIQCGAPGPLCSVALCCAPALPTAAPPTLAPLIMPTLSPGMLARPCAFTGVAADVDAAVSDAGCRSGGSVPPKGVCYVYQGGGACQRMQCADTGAWVAEVCPNTPPAVTCAAGGSPPCVVELYEDGSQAASVGAAGTATLVAAGLLSVSPFSDGVGAGEKRQTMQGTCTCTGAGCTSATVDAASGKVTASVTANAAAAVVMVSCAFADNGSPARSTPSAAVAYLKILAVNDVPLATLVKTRAKVAVNGSHAVDEKMEILRQVMAGPAGARDEDKQVISGSCTGDSAVFDGQPTLHFASAASGGTVTVPTTATMMYRVRAGAPTGETAVVCEVRDGAGGVTKLAPVTIEVVRMAVQTPTQAEKDAVTPKQVREDGSTMSFRIDGAGFPANLTGASLAFVVVGPDGKALKYGVGPPVLTVYSDRSVDDAPNGVLATMAKDPTFIKVSVSADGKSMQMTMKGGDYAAVSPKDEKLRIKLSQSVFGVENPEVVCAAGTCEDSLTIASESPRFPNQEQLTDTQNAVVAITSVSSVVLAAGVSTGTKTGILAMTTRAMLCPGDGPDKLDRTLNPLGLHIGDSKFKEYNGAVIGAALVNGALMLICSCAAVFVLHMLGKSHGVSLGSFVRNDLSTKIDRRYVLMKARFGWTLIPMSFLYGGATVAAVTTVVYSDTFFRVLGGALTALFVIGLPVYSFRAAAHVNKFTDYVPIDPDVPGQALSWKVRFFWGQMEYVPKEAKVGSRTWTALHHLTFDGYTHWWRYFLFVELIVMMFLSVFTAWQPDTQRSCWIRAVLMTCVLVVFTLILVLGRPYLAIYENVFESLIAITETVMMILTCSAMGDDNPAKSWQADVSGKLGVGCVYLILLKFIIDSTIFVIDEFTTWKEEGGSGKLADFARFWFFFQGATADEGAFVALDKQGQGLKELQVTAFEGEDLGSDRSGSEPEHAAQQQQLVPLRSSSAPSPALAVSHSSTRRLSTFANAMPASGGANPMVRKSTRSYTPVDPDVMDGGGESLRELAAAYPRERSLNGSDGESSMGGSGMGGSAGRGTTGSPLLAKPVTAAVPRPKRRYVPLETASAHTRLTLIQQGGFEGRRRRHRRQFCATACPGRLRHDPSLLNRQRLAALQPTHSLFRAIPDARPPRSA